MKKISQTNNEYVHDVQVSVSGGPGDEIEPLSRTIPIRFSIDLESRTWGIKNVYFNIIDQSAQIPVRVIHWGENGDVEEEKTIIVDFSQLRQRKVQSKGVITLGDLDVYLRKDFSVDYKASSLELVY